MSRQRDFSLNERISNIRSTLDELDVGLNAGLGSFDSARDPSLLRRVDSITSFASDQSLERFLSQQRDSRRVEIGSLIADAAEVDFASREENRPLAALPQRWDGTFNRASPHPGEAGFAVEFPEEQSSVERRPARALSEVHLGKDESTAENLTSLQAELYMKLEDCQRELDYARNYSIEQETQAALRIEELEKALQEALHRDTAGEPLAGKLHDAEVRLAEANRRARMWEERFTHADERCRVLEDRIQVLEERGQSVQERSRSSDLNYRKLEDAVRTLQRERDTLLQEATQMQEATANSEAVTNALREELRRLQQDLRTTRERLTTAESVITDLQQENAQSTSLRDLLVRKEAEISQLYEEKCAAEQRAVDLKALLQQRDEFTQAATEVRVRETELRTGEVWSRKTVLLETTIAQLTAEKENMSLELRTRPSVRYVRELETKLEDAEYRLAHRRHTRYSMSVTPTRSRSVLRDQKSFDVGHKHKHSDHTVIHQLQQLLNEENPSALLSRIRGLLQVRRQSTAAESLQEKLSRLVTECSPPQTEKPTAKQVWQWVRRVVEDFMQLKSAWAQVMRTLGTEDSGEVLKKVTSLMARQRP